MNVFVVCLFNSLSLAKLGRKEGRLFDARGHCPHMIMLFHDFRWMVGELDGDVMGCAIHAVKGDIILA